MNNYWGSFDIKHEGNLHSVALKINDILLGGLELKDSDIYDEVPTVVSEKDILGMNVILSESLEPNWYILEIKGKNACSSSEKDTSTIDAEKKMDNNIMQILRENGIEFELTRA